MEKKLIIGPLAGVSSAPFRGLVWRYSAPAFCCTEMISCKTILYQADFARERFLKRDPIEKALCYQLSATDPKELGEAVKIVTDFGADAIDLNCGCPKKKIRQRGAGSAHLENPKKLAELIHAMRENTHLPISVKIRSNNDDINAELVRIFKDSGLDRLIVHGRHWTEQYETPCRYEPIQYFVNELQIPVIGNGDIRCVETLKQMLNTGCAAVMIGRASVGQPWLIAQLEAELNGEKFIAPTSNEIGAVFVEHVTGLVELERSEKIAILQARKLAKYYARALPNKAEFCEKINACNSLLEFSELVRHYF